MSFDHQPRQQADTFVGRVRSDVERIVRECLDELLDTAAQEQAQAVEAALASARAETGAAVEAAVASAREEWAEQQEAHLAHAREEARLAAEADAASRAREQAEHEHENALAGAMASAREQALEDARLDHEAALADARARAWEDARVAFEEQLARVRQEARDELERTVAAARAETAREPVEAVASALPDDGRATEGPGGDGASLRDAVARLDEATSLSECLDALSDGVAGHAARVMVFVLRGHVLRAWRLSGFADTPPSPAALSVPLDLSGELWPVAERGRQKDVHPRAFGRDTDPALAFACLDGEAVGLATPVLVAGRTVAVVYADSGDRQQSAPSGWPARVEILTRHASRCLEALTAIKAATVAAPSGAQVVGRVAPAARLVSQAGPASASDPSAPLDLEAVTAAERYAKLLVSEVKLYNEAAVRVARHKKDIRARLRAEIDRARRLYHERVPASVLTRDEIFDQEILRTLAEGQSELLGADMPEAV